jgi:hypothetical protein
MSWRASTDVFGCNFSSNKALIQVQDGEADVAGWFFGMGGSANGYAHHWGYTAVPAAIHPLGLRLDEIMRGVSLWMCASREPIVPMTAEHLSPRTLHSRIPTVVTMVTTHHHWSRRSCYCFLLHRCP